MEDIMMCSKCVLDSNNAPDLQLDSHGECNYCKEYEKKYGKVPTTEELENRLSEQLKSIKASAKNTTYDSIMGLSGGVDSSYLAYKAKEWGLNPLLVHFDNGWNSELAVQNIEKIVNYTGFDLYTYVVDWDEFKDLQRSYILAGVLDWEIPTDHGFYACLFNEAYKRKIDSILTGHNYQTEFVLPKAMRWSKMDVDNIIDIHSTYGTRKLKSMPLLPFFKKAYMERVRNFKRFNLLENITYNKDEAKKAIIEDMGWRDYGGKHYESIFTRYYQGYVLIKKFGFDKRRAHLSNLIMSGQMSRDEAIQELANPAYEEGLWREDHEYVAKKLGFTVSELEKILEEKPVSHEVFKSYETGLFRKHERFMKTIAPVTKILKSITGKK
jgi:N-acetyl sugar amidotransferase